jgi:hypothetical protein
MTARRLLFLDAAGLTAYLWRAGHLHREGSFAADDAGILAFGEYLQGHHRDSLFHLLVDMTEEGFQIEDVPYVQGRDRQVLIQRKLGQFFYGTPLATAISLGRLKEGRRDERILFAGLTGYAHIEPWLQPMRHAEARLAGIYSMPLAIASALGGLLAAKDAALVITLSPGGLRQTFFDRGQLRFSRLTPMAGGSLEEIAVACAIETDKIYQYLASQRLIDRGTPLDTLVVAHPDHQAVIRNRCPDTPERHLRCLDLLDYASRCGLHTLPEGSSSEGLFLHMLLHKPLRQQLAPAAERRHYRLWQTRFGLHAAALAIIVISLLFAGQQGLRWFNLAEDNRDLHAQIDSQRQRYDSILQALPKVPISNDDLRLLAERHQALVRRSPGLESLLLPLSRGLDLAPGVELTRLTWHLSEQADGERSALADQQRRASRTTTPQGSDAGGYAVLEVEAQLPARTAVAPRSQRQAIEGLAAAIRADGSTRATIIAMPMETESSKTIKSSGEATAPTGPQAFSLRLVRTL